MADPVLAAFIARQRLLLTREREAEIDRTSLLLSNCAPRLLEQKGLALGSLSVSNINVGLGGKTILELKRSDTSPIFPSHSFRPGDLARIERHVTGSVSTKKPKKASSSEEKAQYDGIVYKVSDTRIVIALEPDEGSSDGFNLPEWCRVVKLANSVTYDRMDGAIDRLERIAKGPSEDNSVQMTPLIRVLLGLQPPSKRVPVMSISFFDEKLNPSQKTAIRFCLESPEIACIHGPPGTGKTHTLIELIRQLTTITPSNPKSQRLLVCGASNLSVDNILERLLALPIRNRSEKLKVTRIGHPARVMAHQGILDNTLEVQATRSDQAALAKDVKSELEATLNLLSGKGKGSKGKAPRGPERKKLWEEVKALRREYRQRESSVVKSVLSEVQVVLATCHTSGGRQLQNHEFDVVIIDEATQALEAACWIPIFKAKKLILAGDPMQLPPTIISIGKDKKDREKKKLNQLPKSSTKTLNSPKDIPKLSSSSSDPEDSSGVSDEETIKTKNENSSLTKTSVLLPPRTLETTLFDRLEQMYGSSIKKMLEIQYRMHADICEFPSKTLYSSKLISHESVASHLLVDLPNTSTESEEDAKEALQTPVTFFDTSGCEYYERLDDVDGDEGSRCNENEATIVSNWISKLTACGVLPSQIAIITPYQAQVVLLNSLLRPEYGPELEIGTVDGMQGREKEAIVISLVRSNDAREVGFLKEKRRLNVAMTRARRHLCVIGDSSTVAHGGSYLKKWLAWLEGNADIKYAGLD